MTQWRFIKHVWQDLLQISRARYSLWIDIFIRTIQKDSVDKIETDLHCMLFSSRFLCFDRFDLCHLETTLSVGSPAMGCRFRRRSFGVDV